MFLSEASDNEYIVVDVIRDPGSPVELIFRYYIDPTKYKGTAWKPHDVAIDIEAAAYASCLGRKAEQGPYPVDGIYTSGTVGGRPQFVYAPLFNAFDSTIAPNPDVLHLPGGGVPDAIAASRNSDNTSDLYAAASGALYYLASTNQENDATGVLVARNDLFNRVRSLFAFQSGPNQVMVWGLNANDQIFYTTCALDKLQSPAAWSVPVPILASVEQVTPYMNKAYSANTFFAHTGENKLVKAVKSPDTLMWTFREITLPPTSTTLPAQKFSSYTTRVQVTDASGQPPGNVPVSISASNVTSVYINHIYYVISGTPIEVNTDALGSLTIVEGVDTLKGTQLTIGAAGAPVKINPMEKPLKTAAGLDNKEKLKGATIHYLDGSTKLLVPPGVRDTNLDAVANSNAQLATAYASVERAPPRLTMAVHGPHSVAAVQPDAIIVDVGDFFAWIGHEIVSGIEHVVKFVEDAAGRVWSVIVEVAGKVYQAVLDSAEAIVSAATWLYNAINTAVKDLISFLEFLFDPADLKRTKEVIKNVVKLFLKYQVDQIKDVRRDFDQRIKAAEAAVNEWAGVGSWSGLGDSATTPVNSKSTPAANQSAPGGLFAHHYQGNAGNWSPQSPVTEPTVDMGPMGALINAIENEVETIGTTIERLGALADNFTKMSLEDALRQLLAIVADLGLESVKNVVDALFDVIASLVDTAINMLDTPIHIPVLSDILKEFGVPEFSFLDIACWIAAIPTNLLYKTIHGATPFPDDKFTSFLISAPDYATLSAAFQTSPPPPPRPRPMMARAPAPPRDNMEPAGPVGPPSGGPIAMPPDVRRAILAVALGSAAFCTLVSAIADVAESAQPSSDNPLAKPSIFLAIVAGALPAAAGFLVPYETDPAIAVTAIRVTLLVIHSGPVQGAMGMSKDVVIKAFVAKDRRGVGAFVDALMVLPALFVSIWHFVELGRKPEAIPRSAAIIHEVSNLTSCISRIGYAVAVNAQGPVKAAGAVALAIADICTAGLLIGEAVVSYSWRFPDEG